jgi:hypothetical protein
LPTVKNVIHNADGGASPDGFVRIEPVASDGSGIVTYLGAPVAPVSERVDPTGAWSLDLIATGDLLPSGSYYLVAESGGERRATLRITVPAGGPFWVYDLRF